MASAKASAKPERNVAMEDMDKKRKKTSEVEVVADSEFAEANEQI